MKWKLFHKIFASYLLMSLLIVGLLVVTVQLSASRNFADYVAEVELENLDDFASALAASYSKHQGWNGIKDDPRLWHETLRANFSVLGPERPLPPWPPSSPPPFLQQGPNPPANTPDRLAPDRRPPFSDRPPPPPPELDPLNMGRRLSLLDSAKQFVAGARIEPKKAVFREISVQGKNVGWLRLAVRERLSNPLDVNFLKRQSKAIYAIGFGLFVLTSILSLLLSKHLAAPIRQLISGTRAVASLDFDTAIMVRTRDELGQLAEDFNAMARTLRRYEQMRKQWLSDISHEMRTPLSILRGEIEALQDGVRKTDSKALESLHSEVLYISRIVDDLHELALAESGALRFDKKPIHPIQVLRRTVGIFKDRFDENRINVIMDLETPADTVLLGDPNRLEQLFSNLLENTLRYVDKPGTLTIRSRQAGAKLHLDFDDTGPGVPETSLPLLFDRLYRVDPSRSRSKGGSGLGLAICKDIVESHGGKITALSAPTGGLRIRIVFPIRSAGENSR